MRIDDAELDSIAQGVGITDEELEERKAFLELTESDLSRLKQLHHAFTRVRGGIVDEFYGHLLAFEEMQQLLTDDGSLDRLKRSQSAYFDGLTSGVCNAAYSRERLRIGIAHERIGLGPKWYLGAYRKYISLLYPHLKEITQGEKVDKDESLQSLLKIIFYDMSLAIDTYIEERQRNIHLKVSQLAAINQVATALTSSLTMREVLDEVMRCAIEVTQSKASCIAFYDQQEVMFREWVTQGLSEEFVGRMKFRRGGLADEAFTEGDYILSNDLPESRHKLSRLARKEGIRSFVCLPLTFRRFPLGVLYVYRSDRDRFYRDEIELLSTFASLAAGAINNARQHEHMTELASLDALTGLSNRRCFDERLDIEAKRCARYHNTFSILMVDVDYFKQINDTYGHAAGDIALRNLARLLQQHVRTSVDLVARFGGEEFTILFPDTGKKGALHAAERIRRAVEKEEFSLPSGEQIRFTVSIGIATYEEGKCDGKDVLARADDALYTSKQSGRNRCTLFEG